MDSPSKAAGAAFAIRRMELRDVEPVRALAAALEHMPHWPAAEYVRLASPEALPSRIALVAETASGEVAGLVIARVTPPEAELEAIGVAIACQRQGLAQRLFAALAAELQSAAVRDLLLEVRVSNLPAQSLYRLLGFVETGWRPGYYRDPVEDAILMRRVLDAGKR